MNKTRTTLLIMAALLLAACGPKGAPGVVPVPEEVPADALAPLVRSIELTPLETHEEDFLGEGTMLILADGKYLLLDQRNRKLHLYGPDGRFLNRIGRYGRGPGEYEQLWNVLYAKGRIYVYQGRSDLLIYRPDGSLEETVTLPVAGGNAFYPLEDGYLGYIGYAYAGDDMVQLIRQGQDPEPLIPKPGPVAITLMVPRSFSEYGGRIFMPMSWGHEVYAYADGQAEQWLDLDFGRFTIGEDFFSGDLDQAFQVLQTRYASVGAYWENDQMRVVLVSRVENKEDGIPVYEALHGIFRHGKWDWFTLGDALGVAGLEDDALVCQLDPSLLPNLDPALREKVSNPEVLDKLDEEGNYVIAKLHLK